MSDKQKVVMSRVEEQDVVAPGPGAGGACFEVFRFTSGRLHDREHFLLDGIDEPAAARRNSCAGITPCGTRCPPR